MIFESLKRLFGGMNSDSDLLDIKQGDTISSLNVRTITEHGNTSGSAEAVLGNEFAFDLGEVVQQNKIIRAYFDVSASRIYTVRIIDQNAKNIIPTQTFNTAAYINNITGFFTNMVTVLSAQFTTYGQTFILSSTVSIAPYYGYITLEITTILGRDFRILGVDTFEVQEAIDKSLCGKNIVTGSRELLGDLFILSTPVTKDPVNVTISNVTNTTPITVTTATPHGLETGESVTVKSVGGVTSANGNWIVSVINSTQIVLLGSTLSGAYTSGGLLTKNVGAFGELGVAQKNIATGAWTYISLASTKRFRFLTTHQAEMRAEVDGIRKSLYWTDNNDYYRVAYYYGAYVTNGLFTAYNSQAIYTLDTLDDETKLFLPSPNPFFTVSQENGGNLKCGNWRYSVRFVVEGSIASEWSYLTNPINVYPTITTSNLDAQYVVGGTPDQVSSKLNVIRVDNIPLGVYNFVELAAIQYVGTVPIGSIAVRQAISKDDSFAEIRHTGSSINELELDLTTLAQVFAAIIKGQNLLLLDNRLTVSNYTVQQDYDLSGWAQQIQTSVKRKILQSIEFISSPNGLKLEEYLRTTNTFNFVGYMPNETYRLAVRVKWRKANWSAPYFIRDFTINKANGLPDYSLTDGTGTQIYVPYIQFTNLNTNFVLPDGSVLADLIEDSNNIQFLRAEMDGTNWEVLCTGVLAGAQAAPPSQPDTSFISNPPTPFTGLDTLSYMYSPDVYFRSAFPSNSGGLVMKFLDAPPFESGFNSGSNTLNEFTGDFTGSDYVDQGIVTSAVVDLSALFWGNNVFELGTGPLTPPLANGAVNVGLYYAQLFRPITNKFGSVDTTRYVTTGNPQTLSRASSTADTFDMFGGDTFTQKSYKVVKQVSSSEGYGISFFSQNRVNSSMHLAKDSAGTNIYTVPGVGGTTTAGLLNFLGQNSANLFVNPYNVGYNIQNSLQFYIGFDLRTSLQNYFPVRIAWSEQKVINGISDSYRVVLPQNYTDILPSYGSITHMDEWNGIMLTWQPRYFLRQYFKSNGKLSSDVGEILIGDGSILSRDGDNLSKYGCSHKWAIIKGFTAGGKDFLNWICAEYKKLMRFGLDGTVVLSDEKFMQSFFSDNLQYTMNYFTPAHNYGITGVYNVRFYEAIFTIRCINPNAILAEIGQVITTGNLRYGTLYSFDGVPIIYKAKSSFTITAANYPATGANWTDVWEQLLLTDKEGYNLYTIVSNELINKITSFFTFKPKIYLQYRDGYLSPSPLTQSKLFEHDRGEYLEWYKETLSATGTIMYTAGSETITGIGTTFTQVFPAIEGVVYYLLIGGVEYEILSVTSNTVLTLKEPSAVSGMSTISYNKANSENGFVIPVINDMPDENKGYRAMRVNSEVVPFRIEFTTQTLESYLEQGDFEEKEKIFFAAIKCDSTVTLTNPTGSNESDTSSMWGKYLTVKMFFEKRKYQKVYDLILKFVPKARLSNR